MTNVAGHLREQNGMYQMILSWKDTNGKRRTKSISTGLPVKGNKKELNLCCVKLMCTPNTGHPVLGVFLCDTVMNTKGCVLNCINKGNGQKHPQA